MTRLDACFSSPFSCSRANIFLPCLRRRKHSKMSDGEIAFLQIFSGHCTREKERYFQSRYATSSFNFLLVYLYTCRLNPSLQLSLCASSERPSRFILMYYQDFCKIQGNRTTQHRNGRLCVRHDALFTTSPRKVDLIFN